MLALPEGPFRTDAFGKAKSGSMHEYPYQSVLNCTNSLITLEN